MTNLRTDDQTRKAVGEITKDPVIVKLARSKNIISSALGLLNKPNITTKEMADAAIETSNTLAQGGSASMGKLERTEYNTAAQKWADFKQELLSMPQSVAAPEIINRMRMLAAETQGKIAAQQYSRAKEIGVDYQHNPTATKAVRHAIDNYNPQTAVDDLGIPHALVDPGLRSALNNAFVTNPSATPAQRQTWIDNAFSTQQKRTQQQQAQQNPSVGLTPDETAGISVDNQVEQQQDNSEDEQ